MYLAIASKQLNAFWNECLASIKDNANTISPNRIGVRAYSIHTHTGSEEKRRLLLNLTWTRNQKPMNLANTFISIHCSIVQCAFNSFLFIYTFTKQNQNQMKNKTHSCSEYVCVSLILKLKILIAKSIFFSLVCRNQAQAQAQANVLYACI